LGVPSLTFTESTRLLIASTGDQITGRNPRHPITVESTILPDSTDVDSQMFTPLTKSTLSFQCCTTHGVFSYHFQNGEPFKGLGVDAHGRHLDF
jgi:hypothetical protein